MNKEKLDLMDDDELLSHISDLAAEVASSVIAKITDTGISCASIGAVINHAIEYERTREYAMRRFGNGAISWTVKESVGRLEAIARNINLQNDQAELSRPGGDGSQQKGQPNENKY